MSVNVCPEDIFWTAGHFVTKLAMIMQHHVSKRHAENWFTVLNVKVTARADIIKTLLFLLYLLNWWSVCHQTWFDSTASQVGMSCGKIGLLHSRSRSQQRFKMSLNIFWMISSEAQNILLPNLVLWCSIMSQCYAEFCCCCCCYLQRQCQGHSKGWYGQNMTVCATASEVFILQQPNVILWQPNFVWWYLIVSLMKRKRIIHWRSRSQQRVKMSVFVRMVSLNCLAFG